jgi:Secretion system C-terminal sorting domain
MRFMESQDEDRIVSFYSMGNYYDAQTTFKRTMPMASTVFTVPGLPMIWNGQEVGWGYGISGAKEARNRSVIDWNYQGAALLSSHYQRLAWIRGSYPAFTTQSMLRIATASGYVYGFTRPYLDENGLVAVNFSDVPATATLSLAGAGNSPNVFFTGGAQDDKTYFLSDLYNDTSYSVKFTGGTLDFPIVLKPYGTSVFVLSDSARHLTLPSLTSVDRQKAREMDAISYSLETIYPNPFNPSTTVVFALPASEFVRITAYDILGREVATILADRLGPGEHSVAWNAAGLPSGVYLLRMESGGFTQTRRALLLR